jgi:hypothetical protein
VAGLPDVIDVLGIVEAQRAQDACAATPRRAW